MMRGGEKFKRQFLYKRNTVRTVDGLIIFCPVLKHVRRNNN